ncbi:MAG: cyclodeaminase/cyclohydrolase family protein [Candidatus Aceula meridiana]|nr:cyclodeaminase/cyclohydrolase family protein [Candidatus Aceula meridiana]
MKKFKNQSLAQYLKNLASKNPAPGGGSAAALVAATGVSLISMAARYSLKKNQSSKAQAKLKSLIKKSDKMRLRLLDLVDLDAKAYLEVVKTRKGPVAKKKAALKKAQAAPLEVCRLSYAAIGLTPFLAKEGNLHLLSDVKCAVEMLLAAFQSAVANVEVNQT